MSTPARTDRRRSAVILTHRFDPTADMVVERLHDRGTPVFRFDTADFPEHLSAHAETTDTNGWRGALRNSHRSVQIEDISGIYYRRPTSFRLDSRLTTAERRWASTQARLGFGGLLAALPYWLNHPAQIGSAEYKPRQLSEAMSVGFRVPRTAVTNDPRAAADFARRVGSVLYKPFGGHGVHDTEGAGQVFATPVTAHEITNSGTASSTMNLFQEWVPKDFEVRLTVVDDSFHAARIDASSDAAHIDWRADYMALEYRPIDVPAIIRAQTSRFLKRLGLRFGALDFVVTPSGDWWFLECNPNGQWAWIEEHTGLPIAAAIAAALAGDRDEKQ